MDGLPLRLIDLNFWSRTDKEKAIKLAKKKGEELKVKCGELIELGKEKGTPVLESVANEVREKAILVTKEVLNRLEKNEEKSK